MSLPGPKLEGSGKVVNPGDPGYEEAMREMEQRRAQRELAESEADPKGEDPPADE